MFKNTKIVKLDEKIRFCENQINNIWKAMSQWTDIVQEQKNIIEEVNKKIDNIPLITKYQKTLDLMLKNKKGK